MLAARALVRSARAAARPRGLAGAAAPVRVGDAVPDLEVQIGWPPKPVALRERLRNRRVVVVGLPGAFTPT